MVRKIGERFDFKGEILEVVEAEGCTGCHFRNYENCSDFLNIRGDCGGLHAFMKPVIFKKADKSVVLLTKAHQELVRCGIESEIVQEIEEYLKTKRDGKI